MIGVEEATDRDIGACTELWNRCCSGQNGLVYAENSPAQFQQVFFHAQEDTPKVNLVARSGAHIVGFANGSYVPGQDRAFVTAVMIDVEYRRRGIGTRILRSLEDSLVIVSNDRANRFETVFFNPVNLRWIVPGTDDHDHPNAPGVDVATDGYLFLKNNGYRDYATENSYYLPLEGYRYSRDIRQKAKNLETKGLRIVCYEPERHSGLDELFDDLGSDDWRSIVAANLAADGSKDTVLIVEHEGVARGFTGPVRVQPSGRGYFAGIGVHSKYRGRGAGTVLFAALCLECKNLGAQFMTLFTGETNPARNIYEAAGFKIVKTWAAMRKERTYRTSFVEEGRS